MTTHALTVHPSGADAGLQLTASAELTADATTLTLVYRLVGDVQRIDVPAAAAPQRTDGLWESTCFEAFVAPAGREDYVELNVSPSSQWAVYAFTGYRAGMQPLTMRTAPTVKAVRAMRELNVTVAVDLGGLVDAPWPWHVNLAAVVRDVTGRNSYWALRHPRAKPDFHDPAARVLRLEGPVR